MKQQTSLVLFATVFFLQSCIKDIRDGSFQPELSPVLAGKSSGGSSSKLIWQKCYGTSGDDYGYAIARTYDGNGYFIGGSFDDAAKVPDALVMKTDLNGTVLWQRLVGGSKPDDIQGVVATPDGGCLAVGHTESSDGDMSGIFKGSSDVLLLKYSSSGDLQWKQTLGGSQYDRAHALIATSDGQYAFVGETISNDGDLALSGITDGKTKIWFVKFTDNGTGATITLNKIFGVNGGNGDVGYGLTELPNIGFGICGRTLSSSNDANIYVVSTDVNGNPFWSQSLGGTSGDVAFGITPSLSNNGYVVAGYIGSNAVAINLNNDLSTGWQTTYMGNLSGGIMGRAITNTVTGYVLVGSTNSNSGEIISTHGNADFFAVQINADGSKTGTADVFGGKGDDIGRSVLSTADGSFISLGQTTSNNGDVSGNHGSTDVWLLKYKF
jgi:hypothetical protein